jgi:hypothetical protein
LWTLAFEIIAGLSLREPIEIGLCTHFPGLILTVEIVIVCCLKKFIWVGGRDQIDDFDELMNY